MDLINSHLLWGFGFRIRDSTVTRPHHAATTGFRMRAKYSIAEAMLPLLSPYPSHSSLHHCAVFPILCTSHLRSTESSSHPLVQTSNPPLSSRRIPPLLISRVRISSLLPPGPLRLNPRARRGLLLRIRLLRRIALAVLAVDLLRELFVAVLLWCVGRVALFCLVGGDGGCGAKRGSKDEGGGDARGRGRRAGKAWGEACEVESSEGGHCGDCER
jgi:hypothetical protein